MDDVLSESEPVSFEDQEMLQRLLELLEKERIIALTEAARRMRISKQPDWKRLYGIISAKSDIWKGRRPFCLILFQ